MGLKCTDAVQLQKELGFVVALALTPFKRNHFRHSNPTIRVPWHNATPRRMLAMRLIADNMGYAMLVTEHSIILKLRVTDTTPVPTVSLEFRTPQDTAAWLLDRYYKRNHSNADPGAERV